jgi:hippurate hydrolase
MGNHMPAWDEVLEQGQAFFEELHQFPELRWQEEQTAERIRARLNELNIPWRACAGTGTVGTLASSARGKHIALRGDIDALPIHEMTRLPYASQHQGCMHACGHDGHSAVLMATAHWLKQHESELDGPVSLIFQPAEEGGHGAKKMIEDGALEGVDEIYGWHNWPAIQLGQAVCPDGAVMAANGGFQIIIRGEGGHASQPEACRDPVLAGSAMVLALQQIVSRHASPQEAAVVSVTSFDGKSGPTVIPEVVTLSGSIRSACTERRDQIGQKINDIATATAIAYGVEAEVAIEPCYGATVNHSNQALRWRNVLEQEFGSDWHCDKTPLPIMGSEDFSYYLNKVPGAFALIGNGEGEAYIKPCHSPQYQFNAGLIERVVRMYCRLVGVAAPGNR